MRDRARDWSEHYSKVDGRAENGEEGIIFFVVPPHSPGGCASRSLQSLNYCGLEKKGTACSLHHSVREDFIAG